MAALVSPEQNVFFSSPHTISIHWSPAIWAGQSYRITCLFICVCVYNKRDQRGVAPADSLISPVQNVFSSPHTISIHLSPSPASWAGSRAASPVICVYVYKKRDKREVAPADCWNWGKWGTRGVHMEGGPSLVGLLLNVPVQDIFVLPARVSPVQNQGRLERGGSCWLSNQSSPHTISIQWFPSPSKLVRQSCRVAYLLICVYVYMYNQRDKRGVASADSLISPVQMFFPRRTLFQFNGPHRLANWAVVPRRLSLNIVNVYNQRDSRGVAPADSLISPVQNLFFLTAHDCNAFVPIALGSQSCRVACLLIYVCVQPERLERGGPCWLSNQPSTAQYFNSFSPIAQQAGQAVVPRRLSLNLCLCVQQIHPDVASSLPSMNAAPRRKFAQVPYELFLIYSKNKFSWLLMLILKRKQHFVIHVSTQKRLHFTIF